MSAYNTCAMLGFLDRLNFMTLYRTPAQRGPSAPVADTASPAARLLCHRGLRRQRHHRCVYAIFQAFGKEHLRAHDSRLSGCLGRDNSLACIILPSESVTPHLVAPPARMSSLSIDPAARASAEVSQAMGSCLACMNPTYFLVQERGRRALRSWRATPTGA